MLFLASVRAAAMVLVMVWVVVEADEGDVGAAMVVVAERASARMRVKIALMRCFGEEGGNILFE